MKIQVLLIDIVFINKKEKQQYNNDYYEPASVIKTSIIAETHSAPPAIIGIIVPFISYVK